MIAYFDQNTNKLYSRLLTVTLLGLILLNISSYYSEEGRDFLIHLSFIGVVVLAIILDRLNFKWISKHVFIIGLGIMITIAMYAGSKYYSIFTFPSAVLIFSFIFFFPRAVFIYLIICLSFEFYAIMFFLDLTIHTLTPYFWTQFISVTITNSLLYIMGTYFLNNIKEAQNQAVRNAEDLSQQQDSFKKQNKKLQNYIESNTKLESFTHLAAHELKSPLTSINAYSDILLRKTSEKLNEKEIEFLKTIKGSSMDMAKLINALQDLGTVSQTKLKVEELSFEQILKVIKADRRMDIAMKNASLEVQQGFDTFNADKTLIKQLFSNLIGNALKFTKEGVEPHIQITTKIEEGSWLFTFADNGIGIPADKRDKIFEIFNRLNNNEEFEGSGIGLAISKKIVDLHQGLIWAESNPSGGTIFYIQLPNRDAVAKV